MASNMENRVSDITDVPKGTLLNVILKEEDVVEVYSFFEIKEIDRPY